MSSQVASPPADAMSAPQTGLGTSYGSFNYRSYVLMSLTLVYTFNFIDRILISVVSVPIVSSPSL